MCFLDFLNRYLNDTQISNFTQVCPVGAELFHGTERQIDMMQLIFTFHNFGNTPKN